MKKYIGIVLFFLCLFPGIGVSADTTKEYEGKLVLGDSHTALIKRDGTLWMWGDNQMGELGDGTTTERQVPQKVDGLKGVVDVSLGAQDTGAITEDGSLYMWGRNDYGQVGMGITGDSKTPIKNPVKIMDHVEKIALGNYHCAAITKDKELYVWGSNHYGELGNGKSGYDQKETKPIKIMDHVVDVDLGDYHTAAVKEDGSLYVWGDNYYGQIGDGTVGSTAVTEPKKVMEDVKTVRLGGYTCGAIKKNGSLYMWGNNDYGQTGIGSEEYYVTPAKIAENVAMLALGASNTALLKENGDMWIWGWNAYGQVGNGMENQYTADMTKIFDSVETMGLGNGYCGAITKEGKLYLWGDNTRGQIGNGTNTPQLTPLCILEHLFEKETEQEKVTTWVNKGERQGILALGYDHSGVVKEDGTLWMWGANTYGQLGDGTYVDRSSPVCVMEHVAFVALGDSFTAAIKKDGTLWTWGKNDSGQLGMGVVNESISNPVKIMSEISYVSLGKNFAGAITIEGKFYLWGDSKKGQLALSSTRNQSKPVLTGRNVAAFSLGDDFGAIIKEDRTLWTWGSNDYGQLGQKNTDKITEITKVEDLEQVKEISAGGYTMAAVDKDANLYIWGDNTANKLGSGMKGNRLFPLKLMADINTLSIGNTHCSAVRTDGKLWMWGANECGQIGTGFITADSVPKTILEDVRYSAAGNGFTGIIRNDGSLWMWGKNEKGQLGNGMTADLLEPTKIMEHVLSGETLKDPEDTPKDETDIPEDTSKEENTKPADTPEGDYTKPDTSTEMGNPDLSTGTETSSTETIENTTTTMPEENAGNKGSKQTIKASSKVVVYGRKPFYLNATTSGDGTLSYKSSNKKVATVNGKGKITIKNYGTTTIQITASATNTYHKATKKIAIQVIPGKVKGFSVKNAGKKKVTMSWKKTKSVTGYEIQISSNSKFKKNTLQRKLPKSRTKITVTGFVSNKTMYFRIRTYRKEKKKVHYGTWTKTKKVRIR